MAGSQPLWPRCEIHRYARSFAFEQLDSRYLLTTNPVISELLAVNDTILADEDGDFSDWFEVHNPLASPVDLDDWYVTDDAGNLTKWQFPNVSIPAGGQLLVFASDKDRPNALGELHANFRLSGNGEYLALVEPDGSSIAYEYAPQFPPQTADVSYGLSLDGSTVGFFPQPTPGAANVIDPIAGDTRQIVISEIMYHPFHLTSPLTSPGENTLEEYIEIYNHGQAAVDLTGWRLDRGIDFVFPPVTLQVGEYLVVAADEPTIQANYPDVTNVVGGWQGKLSNRSEEIRLVDDLGATIDVVTYADQGDWAVRTEGPNDLGFRGWVWEAEHDGDGKTLELVNVQVSNDFGQNWAASIPDGGTPGTINSVWTTNTGPLILEVNHAPAIPRSSDTVTVTARIVDPTVGTDTATLYWRVDGEADFNLLMMHDDGQHGDRGAGDSVYGAAIPAQPDETVIEFFVHASDAQQNFSTWPAPIRPTTRIQAITVVEQGAVARAFVPTDDSLGSRWAGGDEPFDDSAWFSGTTGVGYETSGVAPSIAGPIAYWTFNELQAGGTIAPDALDRYDGTVSGAALTTGGGGMFGEALAFDGDDDYVLPGVIAELVDASEFSISLWFRRTVDHAGAAAETNHIVNNVLISQSSDFSNDDLEIGTEGDAVEVYLDTVEFGGPTTTVSQPASIQNDTWQHLVVSYDSGDASELKLYVDGALVSEHGEYGGLLDNAQSPFTIGLARPDSSAWGDFEGLIDDVAVWDTALDAQHVDALFNGTSPLQISSYVDLISLDLQSALQSQNTSAYVRVPFVISNPGSFDALQLRMQYDDAFVAYVNGTEVTRAGLTGTPQWNSAADLDRLDFNAFIVDEFNIANRPGLLVEGQNILAIQLLNFDADAARALVLPELVVEPASHETNAQYQVLDALAGPVIELVEAGAAARAFVPADDSLGTTWTGGITSFNDAAWASGTTGVGYETSGVAPSIAGPIAYLTFDELQAGGTIASDALDRYDGTVSGATLTSGGQGMFGEALAFDGDDDYVLAGLITELVNASEFSVSLWFRRTVDHAGAAAETSHIVNNVLISQSSNFSNDNLEIGTEGNAVEVYLDTIEFGGPTTTVSQPASIQNDTWQHLVVSYDSGDASELKLYVDGALVSEHGEYGGLLDNAQSPFTIGLARPDSSAWGDFEGLIDDVAVWDTALDAQHVAALFNETSPLQISSYADLVSLDLQSALQNQNTSAFVRIPFAASEPESFELLRLRMQYADAFVAYINGTEVARAGVTGAPQWNSAADTDRLDGDAFNPESFLIANQPGLLIHGPNILAIQLLNFDAAAPRALVLPELEAVRSTLEPRSTPVFHQIMTAAQRSEFARINRSSNAQMDATFISVTDTGADVRYNVGIRIRGSGTRANTPPNNRINIPSDRPWQDVTELNINAVGVVNQITGSAFYRLAGLAAADAQPVFMYNDGRNLFGSSPYAYLEPLNTDFAKNHYASDDGGNLYKGRRPGESPPGGQGAGLVYFGTDPEPYVSYQKQTNKSAQDRSDVINLTFQLNQSPNETFLQDVAEVVDIDQWLRSLAVHVVIVNMEAGLLNGDQLGDDYAMYRGVVDRRFQLLPHDLDSLFGSSSAGLLPFTGVSALNRLVNHGDVLPEYGAQVWELANVVLTPDVVKSTLVEALGPLGTEGQINSIVSFMDRRRDYLNARLLAPVSFSLPGGYVDAGSQLTLSSAGGTIYYTTDSSDPRLPGGEINPQALQYTGQPIVINEPTRIIARAYGGSRPPTGFPPRWSGKTAVDYVAAPPLVVTEVNYNPHGAQSGETATDKDNFEFVEVMNVGVNQIDLDGVQFVQVHVDGDLQGIEFTFTSQSLNPGERIVVVKDRAVFQSRYGTGISIADGNDGLGGANGEYGGRLSNRGERVTLIGPSGVTLYSLDYNDSGKWPERPDGGGSSLELVDLSLGPNRPGSWRNSIERGGSPGSAGIGNVDSVVINEVLTNTPGLVDDAIEFYNPTAAPIDIGGMWLSDSLNNLDNYVIPANTAVPAAGYLMLDENDFGFGLSGDNAENVVLVDPGAAENPDLFIDHVSFGPSLPGESMGRWPNGTGAVYPMASTTLGAGNGGPRIGPLAISEVMYHPPNPLLEFIEIYNPTPVTVDLVGWAVNGIGYEFPIGAAIGSGQILVLLPFDPATTTLAADFNSAYEVDIGSNLSGFLGPFPGQLDNGGETLTLQRAAGDLSSGDPRTFPLVIEDQVDFDDVAPWPTEPDGTGASLQRTLVDLWGNESGTWTSAIPTPGRYGPEKGFELTAGSTLIGEVGKLTGLTHELQTVMLSRAYTNPVVFAQPASSNGLAPVVARVGDVQADQFNIFLAEPSNLNGIHTGESVSYVVLEAGVHWLHDGTQLEVGSVDTNAIVGNIIASPTWETVNFTSQFAATPVVLSQTQTTSGEVFLSTRQQPATSGGFQVALEPEEQFGSEHVVETVGYLAIDAGAGIWNEIPFLAALETFVHTGGRRINFAGTNFDTVPSFVASLASYVGKDNAHLRVRDADLNGIHLRSEEDTTMDEEIGHIEEAVTYLAIGDSGSLTAVSTPFVDGLTQTFPLEIADLRVVNDLDVNLELIHSRVADLDLFLEAPDGTTVELFTDIGGTSGDDLAVTLDDEAAEAISAAASPLSGSFQPEGLLRDFDGKAINGTWLLHVTDDTANGNTGVLLNWSLDIELAPDPSGNLNHDSHVNATDIDMLFANIGSSDPTYDLDSDRDADTQDVDHLVLNIMGKRYGDADLDQKVDISDFGRLTRNYDPLGQNAFYSWTQGNFNGDNRIDLADFNRLAMNFSPLGYAPTSILSLAETLAIARRPRAAEATTATTRTGAGEELASTVSGADSALLAGTRSVHVGRPLDGVENSAGEYLVVDHYFRSSRRRHSRLSENSWPEVFGRDHRLQEVLAKKRTVTFIVVPHLAGGSLRT